MTTAATLRKQINDALDSLSLDDQRKVLTYIQSLSSTGRPPGISGPELVEFFKQFPKDAAEEAYRYIREAHEKDSACADADNEAGRG